MSAARLLDITRTLRRSSRLPTGIDRVERAYLRHLLNFDQPLFGVARTALGYLLLDQDGLRRFLDALEGRTGWPRPDLLSRALATESAGAETALRRSALGRALPQGLPRLLRNHLPAAYDYFNVGHSNLTDRVLHAVRQTGGQVSVMVHDVIPLDHPDWQRPGTVEPFRTRLSRVSRYADRVIFNSHDTQRRAVPHLARVGRVPPACVAHLGIEVAAPNADDLPPGLPTQGPYFVTVGTIEPRKNHAFLLDLWAEMGPDAPPLLICGNRGWLNAEVFERLDQLPPDGPIREVSGLSDGALSHLVSKSAGLLCPSLAEGFGLPLLEAQALGARVLCNILPVFREVAQKPVAFHPVSDSQSWIRTIKMWAEKPEPGDTPSKTKPPTWADHFNAVLR